MARIIVVDDSEDICRLLKRALEKDGHSVTALPDTQELDEKLCKAADLILLDVMMPGEDGVAACGRIRAFTDCPILFLTARGEDEDVLNGLGAGGDDYLTKPFSVLQLRARVEAHLRRERRVPSYRFVSGGLRFDLQAKKGICRGAGAESDQKRIYALRDAGQASGAGIYARAAAGRGLRI